MLQRPPVYIDIDDADILAALRALENKLGNVGPLLQAIGEDLVESTKARFGPAAGPDGKEWKENSSVTLAHKKGSRPLTDGGTLDDSIAYQVDGNVLEVGSPLDYAAMMQFGGTKAEFPHLWGDIPARPYLGLSDEDKQKMLDAIHDYLADH